MALQGKFVVNNAHYSPLSIFGVGTFMAFSGNKAYRNRGGCTKGSLITAITRGVLLDC